MQVFGCCFLHTPTYGIEAMQLSAPNNAYMATNVRVQSRSSIFSYLHRNPTLALSQEYEGEHSLDAKPTNDEAVCVKTSLRFAPTCSSFHVHLSPREICLIQGIARALHFLLLPESPILVSMPFSSFAMSLSFRSPFLALVCMLATCNAYPNHAALIQARDNLSPFISAASGALSTGTGAAPSGIPQTSSGTGIYTNSTVRTS